MERLDRDIKATLNAHVDHVEVPPALYVAAHSVASLEETQLGHRKKLSVRATFRRPIAWIAAAAIAVVTTVAVAAPDVVQAGVRKLACTVSGFCGAKNDTQAVALVMDDLRQQVPFLYEFQGIGEPTLSVYRDSMVTLYYRVPEADTTDTLSNTVEGFLYVQEYKAGVEAKNYDSRFSPLREIRPVGPSATFQVNGISWGYYDRFEGTATTEDGRGKVSAQSIPGIRPVIRGQKHGVYYEVELQGRFTSEKLMDLLRDFLPAGR
jgi:hypothetical protein